MPRHRHNTGHERPTGGRELGECVRRADVLTHDADVYREAPARYFRIEQALDELSLTAGWVDRRNRCDDEPVVAMRLRRSIHCIERDDFVSLDRDDATCCLQELEHESGAA